VTKKKLLAKAIGVFYLFLFFGFTSHVNAVGISLDSRLPKLNLNPNIANGFHVFMSQEARNASDVTLTMEKVSNDSSTPSPLSYLDWRDINWKDPFVKHGGVDSTSRSYNGPTSSIPNEIKAEASIRLELKMPSSTSILTSDSFTDLEDPFASSSNAPELSDPFEGYNRFMFDFNEGFYDSVMEPIVREYRDIINEDVRMGISNIFDNAMAPLKLVSSFLQGDLNKTGRVIGRTVINTTLGIGGIFDVADSAFNIKDVNEDLDQVLGSYGVPTGPYIVLPLFGPSTVRNVFGRAGGMFLSPTYHFAPGIEVGGALSVTEQVNDTSFIVDDIEQLEESSIDKYESVRDFYGQYRDVLVNE
jgi:phospholipid-binding lipoprotein MlaA